MPLRLASTGTGSTANTLAAGNDPRFVNGAMQTLSVSTSFSVGTNTTNGLAVPINGAGGTFRQFVFQTAGVKRFELGATNDIESGGAVGTDFQLVAYADDGATITGYIWYAHRATALLTIGKIEVQSGTGAFSTLTANTPAAGDSSGNVATTAFVSNAIDGVATYNTTGGTATLPLQYYSVPVLVVTGALTSNSVLVIPNSGVITCINGTSGAFSLTVKTAAGTGTVITQGSGRILVANGTNVVAADSDNSGNTFSTMTGTTSLTVPLVRTTGSALNLASAKGTQLTVGDDGYTTVMLNGAAPAATGQFCQIQFDNSNYWRNTFGGPLSYKAFNGHQFITQSGTILNMPLTGSTSVNYLQIDQAATGASPALSAQGADTNINLTLSGKGTGGVAVSGHLLRSSVTGLTAAGTTLATALVLTRTINVITTTAASTGVVLPNGGIGTEYTIINRGANTLNIYPPSGSVIDALAASAATTAATLTAKRFVQVSATQYYTA